MDEYRLVAIKSVKRSKGDDIYRAKLEFSRYSQTDMNMPLGQSGKTPMEILADYQEWEDMCDKTIEWLEGL